MAWAATAGVGISGGMVSGMTLGCVERRFGAQRAPHPVQSLAGNGSAYTAGATVDFAAALNLVACFTPVRGRETGPRDYTPRPDVRLIPPRLERFALARNRLR